MREGRERERERERERVEGNFVCWSQKKRSLERFRVYQWVQTLFSTGLGILNAKR